MQKLPASFGQLSSLEVLDLVGCTSIVVRTVFAILMKLYCCFVDPLAEFSPCARTYIPFESMSLKGIRI